LPTEAWIHFSRDAGSSLSASLASACCSVSDDGGGAARRFAQALDRDDQALALGRLEHVVDHALLEGVDRVLVVGGDEHDLRQAAVERSDLARGFDAGLRRHADVQEDHFGTELGDLLDGFDPVLRFRHDLELGPELGEARAQLLAHQGFVVGDYCTGHVAL